MLDYVWGATKRILFIHSEDILNIQRIVAFDTATEVANALATKLIVVTANFIRHNTNGTAICFRSSTTHLSCYRVCAQTSFYSGEDEPLCLIELPISNMRLLISPLNTNKCPKTFIFPKQAHLCKKNS